MTYSATKQPILKLEGVTLGTGAATTAATQYVSLRVQNPYAAGDAFNTVTAVTSVEAATANAFAILLHPGEMGRGTLSRHQSLQAKLVQDGVTATDERLIGEALAAVGSAYLAQSARAADLIGQLGKTSLVRHTSMGIAGKTTSTYVDFPSQLTSFNSDEPNTPDSEIVRNALALSVFQSTLESTAVSQLQKNEAVSTVRMFDHANTDGTGFIKATSANWSAIKPKLSGWATGDLNAIGSWLAANPTGNVVIPQVGNRKVNQWTGSGYYQLNNTANTLQVAYKISGGYKGAYGSVRVQLNYHSIGATADLYVGGRYVGTRYVPTPTFSRRPTNNFSYGPRYSYDPIDLRTGAFVYDNVDITVGSAPFPFGLTFKRRYSSASRFQSKSLGYGWRHNFDMSAFVDSDTFLAFGDQNALSAVATVAALTAVRETLRSTNDDIGNTVIASLAASWMMDQHINNAVTLNVDEGSKRFIKIPTADGKGAYVPPPGDTSTLVIKADKSMVLTDKNKNVLSFGTDGAVTSWKDPNNNTISFTYSGTDAAKKLTSVANGMGRTLTFTYDVSNRITGVSDGTRTAQFTYDVNGNLATARDTAPTPQTTTYVYGAKGLMTQLKYPSFPKTAYMINVYDDFGRVRTQTDSLGNVWHYLFADGVRSQEIAPNGGTHVLYYDHNGNQTVDQDQAGAVTTMTYDGINRLKKVTNHFGDAVTYTYDANSNILTQKTMPVPGATDVITGKLATPVTLRATYDTAFNKPLTTTDARGNITSFTYDTKGNLTRITEPKVPKPGVTGTVAPVTNYVYNTRGLITSTTDPERRITTYAYDTTNFNLLSTTVDSGTGRLNLTTSYTYDTAGNQVTRTDPKGAVTTYAYDTMRRLTQTTAPAPFAATKTKYAYDADGRQTSVAQATGSATAPWQTTTTTYNSVGKPLVVTYPDGSTSTTAYDKLNRPVTVTSSSGRQVLTTYDAASRVTKITDQVSGTLDASITVNRGAVVREQRTYATNGLLATLADGKGNTLSYIYDGFNRLRQIKYPDYVSKVRGSELFGYDADGNLVVKQTRALGTIRYTYDKLNRQLTKAPSGQASILYGYDLTGRLIWAKKSTDTKADTFTYDTAGRLAAENSAFFGAIPATRDKNGNITALTYPGKLKATFTYDVLDRLTSVSANAVRIAGYTYNTLSQRSAVSNGPATGVVASSALTYTGTGQIKTLGHTWNGSSLKLTYTYNPDQQRTGVTATDRTFLPSGLAASTTAYTTNNLNQYATVGATTYTYDKNGNLTSDGTWTYTYDTENRLRRATKTGTTATYSYDALDRRWLKVVNGVATAWPSFGDQELSEYVGVGTVRLTKDFLYGAGIDEPAGQLSAAGRHYYFQDALGSTVALAGATGLVTEKHAYTAYGQTVSTGTPTTPYRFAGRRFDTETGLYHNRARAYSPALGRFLQPDPIGTDGGINLYAYVNNDPVNLTDPTGKYPAGLSGARALGNGKGLSHRTQGSNRFQRTRRPWEGGPAGGGLRVPDFCVFTCKAARPAARANGNSNANTRAQHGYVIRDTHKNGAVVKNGISGGRLNRDGSSRRANSQANKWNREPGNTGRYEPQVTFQVPAGPGARTKARKAEKEVSDQYRSTLDRRRHQRP